MEASVQIARGHPDYGGLVDRVNAMVTAIVPSSETVLVVSKGDESLLRLGSRRGWHFPRSPDGRYAGYYPADSADAIAQLEALRKKGAGYIAFPATSLWWLDHYPDFSRHLESRYQCLVRDDRICAIYALSDSPVTKTTPSLPEATVTRAARRRLDVSPGQLTAFLDTILPEEAIVAVVSSGDADVLRLSGREMWHFPRDPAGSYAGLAPVDSDAAFDQLEGLRARGLAFLVVPRATPWLSHYPEFQEKVERRFRCIARQRYLCSVYDLSNSREPRRRVSAGGDDVGPWRRWLRARRMPQEPEQG